MTIPRVRRILHMRDVIFVLVARDQKARYKSTGMGVFWAVASPVLFLLTFYFLFRVVLPLDIPNYASHLFIGLVAWSWFQGTTTESVTAIVGNASLVNQPRFPIAALPLTSAMSNFVTLCLTLPLLLVILYFEGASLGWTIIILPLVIACQFVFVLAVAYLVAGLNVRFRDLQYIVPIVLQLSYFATPIFYDVAAVPEKALGFLRINPMLTLIEAYRSILIRNEAPDFAALAVVVVGVSALLVLSYASFVRASAGFLEEV